MRPFVVAIVGLSLLAVAFAACPNQCSGHGRCGANDLCECYTQVNTPWGARPMYVGADCSQRTCPLGVSGDQLQTWAEGVGPIALTKAATGRTNLEPSLRAYLSQELMLAAASVTINVRFTTATDFQWKYAADTVYSTPIAILARAAGPPTSDVSDVMLLDPPTALGTYPSNGQTETGIRVWLQTGAGDHEMGDEYTFTVTRATGSHWVKSNDNSMHQATECSSRGICDSATGKCKCFSTHDGEACQRTVCPNSCSGHGICQSAYQFRKDAEALGIVSNGNTYGTIANYYTDANDGQRQMGCKCDNGYRGPDCSLIECPAGDDPLSTLATEQPNQIARDCSGRGVCDYSSGQCKCFKGYFGERCESQTNFI